MPLRLAQKHLITPEVIEYLDNGIQISLPSFLENEEGQVQFVIAWADGGKRNDISTWLAVDMFPEEILEQRLLRY